jgi:hypothetical protein
MATNPDPWAAFNPQPAPVETPHWEWLISHVAFGYDLKIAMLELSRQLAPSLGTAEGTVLAVLAQLPLDWTHTRMFYTPGGWASLSAIVAGNASLPLPSYWPTLH